MCKRDNQGGRDRVSRVSKAASRSEKRSSSAKPYKRSGLSKCDNDESVFQLAKNSSCKSTNTTSEQGKGQVHVQPAENIQSTQDGFSPGRNAGH